MLKLTSLSEKATSRLAWTSTGNTLKRPRMRSRLRRRHRGRLQPVVEVDGAAHAAPAADDEAGALDERLELVLAVVPPVGGLAQPGDLVERLVGDVVHDGVQDDDAAAGREDALQLGQRRRRVGQQVEGAAADD